MILDIFNDNFEYLFSSLGSPKTLEGTAAGIVAQMICILLLSQTGTP
jgi:dolichol kinase